MRSKEHLEAENRDLASRLYYCSNGADGRKMRKELEQRIRKNDKEIAKLEKGG